MSVTAKTVETVPPAAATNSTQMGPVEYHFPCTPAQQALWFVERLNPGNPAFNIAVRLRIVGPLNPAILSRAINHVVERHEILRTTFSSLDGEPVQTVHATTSIPLPLDDLASLNQTERDFEEELRTIREAQLPFDLYLGPLIRVRLLRLALAEHVLLLTMHHIVSDGWSIGIFSDEVGQFYADLAQGRASSLPPLPIQYADYAVWQRDCANGGESERHRSYWRRKLASLPRCEIPTDFSRPHVQTHNAYILSELLPAGLTDELAHFAAAHGCTMHTACLAALKMLIAHHTGRSDIYAGSLLAGRERLELEPLIGVFVNAIVLRTDLSGDPTATELLLRVRDTLNEALAHRDLHFQAVVEAVRPARDPARPVLYGINFIYQRDFVKPLQFAGLTMVPLPSKSPGAIYDLNFFMVRRSDGWRLSCEYSSDLYQPETIAMLLAQLRDLFQQIVRHPHQRLSQFTYSAVSTEPLPPFVPRRESNSAEASVDGL